MSEKKKLIGTRVGGNLSRAVYLPPTQVYDVDFFSSPSFVQPKYKIKMDLKSQDKSYKLVFNVRKIEKIWYLGGGQPVQGGLSRPPPRFFDVDFFFNHHLNHLDIK